MPYRIQYDPAADEHLAALSARDRSIVFEGVHRHLDDSPTSEARNRKQLRPNSIASWDLRLGRLRVYYDVEGDLVSVLAVGVKLRDKVRIGRQVIQP